MYRQPVRGMIRPKISTMPRPRTEASAFLDLHKLTLEKKRLQQELNSMESRRQKLQERVAVIEEQVVRVEKNIQQLRKLDSGDRSNSLVKPKSMTANDTFDTLFLEY
jgi:hypothetical protein